MRTHTIYDNIVIHRNTETQRNVVCKEQATQCITNIKLLDLATIAIVSRTNAASLHAQSMKNLSVLLEKGANKSFSHLHHC